MHISKSLLVILVLSVTMTYTYAQDRCRVLMVNIQNSYEGECKNHLAHGNGTASGIDSYTGSFRKGYPDVRGTYKWATGESYQGEWSMGKREGIGEYHYTIAGKEAIQSGIWKNDRYLGPAPVMPVVKLQQNISDIKITKIGEGNEVVIKLTMLGNINNYVTVLKLNANSGILSQKGGYMSCGSVVFPFTARLTYTTPNRMNILEYDCAVEFEIPEPGRWEVKIENN